MVAAFQDHNNGELKQQRRRRQRERQKSNRFILAKQTLYWTFLSRRCKSVTVISRARFMELLNTAQEFSFFFYLNSDTVLWDSIPDNFAKILNIKRNWIRSMKFETVRGIHFLRDVFALLSSRNFATMATWPNDFSSLLAEKKGGPGSLLTYIIRLSIINRQIFGFLTFIYWNFTLRLLNKCMQEDHQKTLHQKILSCEVLSDVCAIR